MENRDFKWDERNAIPNWDLLLLNSSCLLNLLQWGLARLLERRGGARQRAHTSEDGKWQKHAEKLSFLTVKFSIKVYLF